AALKWGGGLRFLCHCSLLGYCLSTVAPTLVRTPAPVAVTFPRPATLSCLHGAQEGEHGLLPTKCTLGQNIPHRSHVEKQGGSRSSLVIVVHFDSPIDFNASFKVAIRA